MRQSRDDSVDRELVHRIRPGTRSEAPALFEELKINMHCTLLHFRKQASGVRLGIAIQLSLEAGLGQTFGIDFDREEPAGQRLLGQLGITEALGGGRYEKRAQIGTAEGTARDLRDR